LGVRASAGEAEAAGSALLDRTLVALADPRRRRAVDLLRERPRRAGELAAALDLTPSAMSRHLKVLREVGLVTESNPESDARVRVYRLEAGPTDELAAWLRQTHDGWAEQLAQFKEHVEADT
jgi:DNA-binding transcriptional ArsR family regulator